MTNNPTKLLCTALVLAFCTGSPDAWAEKLYVASTAPALSGDSILTFDTVIGASSQATFSLLSGFGAFGGIAFDSDGNLFATSGGNNGGIVKFASINGILSSTPTTYTSGLDNPIPLTVDSAGNLFEAEFGSGIIYKFTNGSRSTFASGLNYCFGLAFDSQGNLFAGKYSSQKIIKFTGGVAANFASVSAPNGLTFDSNGNLWVASNLGLGNLYKFSNSNGTLSSTPVIFAGNLGNIEQLVFDHQGNLFVSKTGNTSAGDSSIYKFANNNGNLSTTPTTFASGLWGTLSLAIGPSPSSSVTINCFAGVIIHGTVGSNYVIQAQANINSSWVTLTNVTLPTSPYTFIDYSSPTNNQQFYRVTP